MNAPDPTTPPHAAADAIRRALLHHGIDDPALVAAWSAIMEVRRYAKGQAIVSAGDPVTHFQLVQSGLARFYYAAHDGKERNKAFGREGDFLGSMSAILAKGPSPFSIDALEDCQLIVTPLQAFFALDVRHPNAELFRHRFTAEKFARNEAREAVLLTRDMEGRYRWLQAHEAWLLERVPQYHIASYLGMDAVSLSRLKSRRA